MDWGKEGALMMYDGVGVGGEGNLKKEEGRELPS